MHLHALLVACLNVSVALGASMVSRDESAKTCEYVEMCYEGNSRPAFPVDGNLPLDCPGLTGKTQRISLGTEAWEFAPTCGLDYIGTFDLLAVLTYRFEDCLRACASYNRNHGKDDCKAIHFEAHNVYQVTEVNYGNCWLKNSTGTEKRGGGNTDVAARLIASYWD